MKNPVNPKNAFLSGLVLFGLLGAAETLAATQFEKVKAMRSAALELKAKNENLDESSPLERRRAALLDAILILESRNRLYREHWKQYKDVMNAARKNEERIAVFKERIKESKNSQSLISLRRELHDYWKFDEARSLAAKKFVDRLQSALGRTKIRYENLSLRAASMKNLILNAESPENLLQESEREIKSAETELQKAENLLNEPPLNLTALKTALTNSVAAIKSAYAHFLQITEIAEGK